LHEGENEIVVSVWDPTDTGEQPRGKQVLQPGGIFYTPITGIWQTVWLEPVPLTRISHLQLCPDLDASLLRLKIKIAGERGDQCSLTGKAYIDGAQIACAAGDAESELTISIPRDKLRPWSPDDPFLYDLHLILRSGEQIEDRVESYFGMRKLTLQRDSGGRPRLMLNDKELFQLGPLDQGYWPDGLYTAPTDEALRFDIETIKKLGFNMCRKHVKIEPARWYYWCDKLGVLVWQDMPNGAAKSPAGKLQFEQELQRLVINLQNHPSLVMWVVFNEGWGQHETSRYVKAVQSWDPSGRWINNASGWSDAGEGDVIDIHDYPGPPKTLPPSEKRAIVLGEFGGLGLPVPNHLWQQEKNWGYRELQNPRQFAENYLALLHQLRPLRDAGLCAAVYTQLTDVEGEVNGLMTYDRDVLKLDADQASKTATSVIAQ